MVFFWSLSDCKSPQVSRTLLSILADLNNAVVWLLSTFPLISKSSSPFTKLVFGGGSCSLATYRNLSLFSFSFNLTLGFVGTAKSTIQQVLSFFSFLFNFFFFFFFLFIITVWPRLGNLYLKIPENRTDSWLFAWSNLNFWHNSLWITFPTQSSFILYSLGTHLHSVIMRLITSCRYYLLL